MLKAWLRELPDELLPKTAQDRIARECAANPSETVPQLLIDELSALSPFNYYLLFAITCHLSLLLAHSEKNKMDYRNLCICFQPCMKIDAFCFKYLVCDWRDCWKGCKTENDYTDAEYLLFSQEAGGLETGSMNGNGSIKPPNSAGGSTAVESHDERERVSSSDSSKPSPGSLKDLGKAGKQQKLSAPKESKGQHGNSQEPSKKLPLSRSGDSDTVSTTLTVVERTPPRRAVDPTSMRPLSPIKPLSPIGL